MKKSKKLISKKLIMLAFVLSCIMAFSACASADNAEKPSASAETDETADAPVDNKETSEPAADGKVELPQFGDIEIPEDKVIKIAYLAQNETIQYCIAMSAALSNEAEKYGSQVELLLIDSRGQIPLQISQAEDAVVKGVDVVILHPNDQEASAPALDIVVNAGIPLVILNTSTVNVDISNSYIGVDDEEAGVMLAQLMSEVLGGKGTVNVMKGMLGDPANENRMTGLERELKNHPGLTVTSAQAADWDRGKAMSLTEDWISSDRDFDGIISMNDEMAISATLTLASANKSDVKVIGVDALDEALELIKAGKMYGTVFQNADAQGRGALNVAVAIAMGMNVQKIYTVPYEPVTIENVDDYMGRLNGE